MLLVGYVIVIMGVNGVGKIMLLCMLVGFVFVNGVIVDMG